MSDQQDYHRQAQEQRTLGDRVSDKIAQRVGSWPFVIGQSFFLFLWVVINIVWGLWDRPPFILLNLLLSFQAGYTGPIVMMAQNRAAARDKVHAEHNYKHQELELKENTEITKQVHTLAKEVHQMLKKQ